MPSTIYGSICYKNETYPFFLEGRRAYIVGMAWNYYNTFEDADAEETISGVTADNRQIIFYGYPFSSARESPGLWDINLDRIKP